MFRFSMRKTPLGIAVVVMAAIGGILFCCWLLRRNPDRPILTGPAANAESSSVYKSGAKRLKVDHVVEVAGPEGGPGVGGPGPGVLPVLPPVMVPVSVPHSN